MFYLSDVSCKSCGMKVNKMFVFAKKKGLGHSHYNGLMAAMNVQPVAASSANVRRGKLEEVIEETTRESCDTWHEEEKPLSTTRGVEVSFDQGWQKQGRGHNSRTGQGT